MRGGKTERPRGSSPTRARRLLAVGIDLGATWLRASTRLDGRLVRVRIPAVGVLELDAALPDVWARWGVAAPQVGALVVASRGIWTRGECRQAEQGLGQSAQITRVIPDAQAAWLGALGGGAGLLVLSGTGSIVVGRNSRGRWARAGGLGPLLGDEGSGFWIGREWLRATTANRRDASLLAIVRSEAPVARIAARAPLVLARARAGDGLASRIVRQAERHLARDITTLARILRLTAPVRVSWAGSLLSRDDWLRAGLQRAVAAKGIDADWVPPAASPLAAATRIARELLDRLPARPSRKTGKLVVRP